ncbi:MAG: hypothetical protein V3V18_01760 [Methylococcales bacterium]
MKHSHGMSEGMGSMHEGMSKMMQGMKTGHSGAKEIAKGAVISTTAHTGSKALSRGASKHPLLWIGVGVVTGYLLHKYRKEIIRSVDNTVNKSKDFVQNQKESLDDIVAEAREEEQPESESP